jgi:hypothetical protein
VSGEGWNMSAVSGARPDAGRGAHAQPSAAVSRIVKYAGTAGAVLLLPVVSLGAGMRLTVAQAARLWVIEGSEAARALGRLERAGVLKQTTQGAYLLRSQ